MDSCPICGSPAKTWPLWSDLDASAYDAHERKAAVFALVDVMVMLIRKGVIDVSIFESVQQHGPDD